MKTRAVLTALLMLTVLPLFSQEGTKDSVTLPFGIAKKIALDLEDLDRLEAVHKVNMLELDKYERLTASLQEISQNKTSQIQLLQNSNSILQTQLQAEKAKQPKNNWLRDILIMLGVFSGGYLAGSL